MRDVKRPGRESLGEAIEAAWQAACRTRKAATAPLIFVDTGHTELRRPALARLIVLVRSGAVDVVAVVRATDLTSDAIKLAGIRREIRQAGAVLVIPWRDRPFRSKTAAGRPVEARRGPRRRATRLRSLLATTRDVSPDRIGN